MRLNGKVALVTGGGRGIGRATAMRFADEGADVALVDLDGRNVELVAGEIEALGRQALPIRANVTRSDDSQRMIRNVLERFGRLDIVFANAGIGGGRPVVQMEPDEWDRVIAVNLRGVFLTCKYAVPALIESGGGAIVTMGSSMAGWDASEGGAAYMASKEGVTGLTKSLALQLGQYGIRVNSICPGIIQTRLEAQNMSDDEWQARYTRFARRIPLRRVGQPEDVAAAVTFLASDDAQHITGSMLLIDGGQTLQSWSNAPDTGDDAYPLSVEPPGN